MIIILGSDHAALDLKNKIAEYLKSKKLVFFDVGTYTNVSCHYPKIANKIVKEFIKNKATHCIALCGTGIGISNAITRYSFIKCVHSHHPTIISQACLKGEINTLALGGRIIGLEVAKECINAFLEPNIN